MIKWKSRVSSVVWFVVLIMAMIVLSASMVFAASKTKDVPIIKEMYGELTGEETITKKFTVPAKAKVRINFIGLDFYDDGCTFGAYSVRITNSNGTAVYTKRDYTRWDNKEYIVELPKGTYTLTICADGENEEVYDDYEDEFWYDLDYYEEEALIEEFEEKYKEQYSDDEWEDGINEDLYDELWSLFCEEKIKAYIKENQSFEYDVYADYTITEKVYAQTLTLNKSKTTIIRGSSEKLKHTFSPDFVNTDITWSTSNSKVATVDKNGKVTAKAVGTATITVKNGKKSTKCKVTVKDTTAKKISIDKTKLSLNVGKSQKLKATLSPTKVTAPTIWTSSNKKIATVDKKGKVKAVSLGTATVTVKNGKKSAKCKVTVNNAKTTILTKKSKSLTSFVKNVKNYKKAKWSSSNTKIATVNSSGTVYGKAAGSCKIYCTVSGVKYAITVSVKAPVSLSVYKTYDTSIYNETNIKVVNNTNKDITYMTLNIAQYDNRGYRLSSPYSYYYINETIDANSTSYWEFWTNDNTKKAKVTLKKVWFSDGTTWTP